MTYGAINVMPLLIEHGVLKWTAPGLPLMVDLAMCAGLWGDRVMHRYGRTAAWVTALRWITATMTLALNVAGPLLSRDYVGLGIHACGPLLILVVAEAAGCFQRIFAEIAAELLAEIDGLRSAALTGTEPQALVETGSSLTGHGGTEQGAAGGTRDQERVSARYDVSGRDQRSRGSLPDQRERETRQQPRRDRARDSERPDREHSERECPNDERLSREHSDGERGPAAERDTDITGAVTVHGETEERDADRERAPVMGPGEAAAPGREPPNAEAIMWEHFQVCVAAGQPVDGAALDLVAGTRTHGRRMLRKWVETGRITEQVRAAARAGHGSPAPAALESARSEEGGQPDSDDSPLQVSMSSGAGASR